ncbi:pyridoxal phosphate-dependent aminotransferase [Jiangella muralis]|uniref:pyridoxal phosphate-dependent aminotransferase n=1 Tax=Jiangella muralis TaxID=702383 RepID=UPI0009F86EE2|nr:pyridoxal phosphate-dependent aminotransferase [Jiangella muralis]
MSVPVSPTLALNEALAQKRRHGLPVLPLGFGEAGLPVHPALREALAIGSSRNAYGPVAGTAELREAAAGYWARRGLPTDPELVVAGPGSKPLLYGLLLALGGDIVAPSPGWVSYRAQARLTGHRPIHVPTVPGQGGVPQPDLVADAVRAARAAGRTVRSVVVTTPDNPTGDVASRNAVERLTDVARELDLAIVSNEIYRDLVHDPSTFVHSPAEFAPERTIVTTSLSKSLALCGWRLGVMRLPDGPLGRSLLSDLLGVASEVWSSPAAPVQYAAAYAFGEPEELTERVERSRRLHGAVVRAVADRLRRAGADFPTPRAGFYLYPDFGGWSGYLEREHGITTGRQLAAHLLDAYGLGGLPAADFEGGHDALRLRLATSLLYGDTDVQRYAALAADDPTRLPWIRAHLDRLDEILTDLARHADPVQARGWAC